MNQEQNLKNKSRSSQYGVIITIMTVIILGIVGYSLYQTNQKNDDIEELQNQLLNKESEITELTDDNQVLEGTISDNLLEEKRKCAEAGEKKFEKDREELSGPDVISPSYVYNKELKTCIYKGMYLYDDGSNYQFITDLYTNQNLASHLSDDPTFGTIEDFNTAVNKYIPES